MNRFTADDLAACSLLSTPVYGPATTALLITHADDFSHKLETIGDDRDLAEVADYDAVMGPVVEAYKSLRAIPSIGETRATKLLARKRPRLVPIIDSVIKGYVFSNAPYQWKPLHEALRANDLALHHRLLDLRDRAGIGPHVSALRVFDVLAWCDGSKTTEKWILPEQR